MVSCERIDLVIVFGINLRAARQYCNYTASELSKMIDITPYQIYKYETTKSTPPLSMLSKIADVFKVEPYTFLQDKESFLLNLIKAHPNDNKSD